MKRVRVIRRSISILLVSVMILALMPASVFAYDYVAKIEYSNGDLASYKTFENAWINLRDKCTLTLLKDCNVNDLLSIPDNIGTVSIEMGGYAIDRQLDSGKSNGEVINIGLNNTITINNGVITGGNSTDDGGGILLSGSGITLNLIKTHITGAI